MKKLIILCISYSFFAMGQDFSRKFLDSLESALAARERVPHVMLHAQGGEIPIYKGSYIFEDSRLIQDLIRKETIDLYDYPYPITIPVPIKDLLAFRDFYEAGSTRYDIEIPMSSLQAIHSILKLPGCI